MDEEEKQTGKTGSFFTKVILSPITIPVIIVLIAVLATVLFWGYNAETFKKADTKVKEVVKTETRSELPVTFDNPILFILLGVAVVAIVIIAIRIRSLSKKNEK